MCCSPHDSSNSRTLNIFFRGRKHKKRNYLFLFEKRSLSFKGVFKCEHMLTTHTSAINFFCHWDFVLGLLPFFSVFGKSGVCKPVRHSFRANWIKACLNRIKIDSIGILDQTIFQIWYLINVDNSRRIENSV